MSAVEVVRFAEVEGYSPVAGVTGVPLFGDSAMAVLVTFEPDAVAPMHSHDQEQLCIVLDGLEILIVDGTEYEIEPMMGYAIPGDVEHGARAGSDGAVAIEIFHPLRQDYLQASKGQSPTPFS